MANANFTQLPTTTAADLTDIIAAVQGGVSGLTVQETLQQVLDIMSSNIIKHNAGNPNGSVSGDVYNFCYDTTNSILYICTTTGTATTAVWTLAGSVSFPISAANGGSGVASPTAHGILVAEGSSPFVTKNLTDGQVLIGSTGADPVAANISAGAGISISAGAGSIIIASTGSGSGWTETTGATQAMVADNGYVANRATLITFTLPATAAFGTYLAIVGKGAGGWSIAQNAGQNIQVGSSSSTVGVGGSVASSNRFDSIELICTTANTTWTLLGAPQGNITIV